MECRLLSNAVPDKSILTPDWRPDFGRTIGFVAGGIGDQIYHLTQLRALAGASSDGKIDLACIHPAPISKLLAHTPWVGKIVDARPFRRYIPGLKSGDRIAALRNGNYDSAFILHRSTSFKLAAAAAGIKMRAGLADSWIDQRTLHHPIMLDDGGARRSLWGHRPFIAAIDAYVTRMGLALDPDSPTILPGLADMQAAQKMLADLPRPITMVNLFALDEKRRWPISAAIEVIATLAAQSGGSFILNAGPDASEYHDETMRQWHLKVAQNKSSKPGKSSKIGAISSGQLVDALRMAPSMGKDVALYHLADFYIGVDSFTANLALNCNLPAIVLFAHARDILQYRSKIWPLSVGTGKQGTRGDGIAGISSDAVIATAQRLLVNQGPQKIPAPA